MARVAGDKPYYTFVLRNEGTGKYMTDVTINLDSVTTIIKRTLAAPQIVGWAYRTTRDSISGMVSVLTQGDGIPEAQAHEVFSMLSDADELEAYLAENRLRPDDVRDEAAERGREGHAFLEYLCAAYEQDEETAQAVAQRTLASPDSNGWDRGIAGWWLERNPEVVASEQVLYSLRHRYAGSTDLVLRDSSGLGIVDLKTRRNNKLPCNVNHKTPEAAEKCHGVSPYDSDHAQVGGYAIAWEEMYGEEVDWTSVLVVTDDGSWIEEETTIPRDTFLSILDVDRKLR